MERSNLQKQFPTLSRFHVPNQHLTFDCQKRVDLWGLWGRARSFFKIATKPIQKAIPGCCIAAFLVGCCRIRCHFDPGKPLEIRKIPPSQAFTWAIVVIFIHSNPNFWENAWICFNMYFKISHLWNCFFADAGLGTILQHRRPGYHHRFQWGAFEGTETNWHHDIMWQAEEQQQKSWHMLAQCLFLNSIGNESRISTLLQNFLLREFSEAFDPTTEEGAKAGSSCTVAVAELCKNTFWFDLRRMWKILAFGQCPMF